jgi:hypothetical protein
MVSTLTFTVTGWDSETCTEDGKVQLYGKGMIGMIGA